LAALMGAGWSLVAEILLAQWHNAALGDGASRHGMFDLGRIFPAHSGIGWGGQTGLESVSLRNRLIEISRNQIKFHLY
jgi:hypothetical protein